MKIKIDNKTKYRSDDLRRLVRAAVEHAGAEIGELRVTVRHKRATQRLNGSASCQPGVRKWHWCSMFLYPKPPCSIDLDRFKKTVIHEAMHLAGATHATMTEEQRFCRFELPGWAIDLPLRENESEPVDPAERRAADCEYRLTHAQAMLTKATTRLKRASTIQKKWARRVKLLEKT